MTDTDNKILALRVAGLSERDVCRQLGCTTAEVRDALNRRAAQMSDPSAAVAALINGIERLATIERACGDKRIRERAKQQQKRHAMAVLRRTPPSRPT